MKWMNNEQMQGFVVVLCPFPSLNQAQSILYERWKEKVSGEKVEWKFIFEF
jgi:hypothetical protein